MLRFIAENKNGKKIEIKNILNVVINSDNDVPADDIALTVPFNSELQDVGVTRVYQDDRLMFEGIADETVNLVKNNRAVTKITARSLAGVLLDNEAEPVTYINPASQFIFDRHLKPFGIKSYDADEIPFYGSLKIEKGMTHWQVLEKFCCNRYESHPRITGDGKAFFRGFGNNEVVCFGGGEGQIGYISIKEDKRPCRLISEVRIRLDEYGEYSGRVKNKNAECSGVTRVRYINAAADNTTVKTADKMIENSNKNSYCIVLECPGCHLDLLGKSAEINDPLLGTLKNLKTDRLKYTLSNDGEITSVMLRKEKF